MWGEWGKYLVVWGDLNDCGIWYGDERMGKGLRDGYGEGGWGGGLWYKGNFVYLGIEDLFVKKGFKVLKWGVENWIWGWEEYGLWCLVEKL